MAGIHPICIYRDFSTNDVERFEKLLIEWCKTISVWMHGKTMLIFDENEFALRAKATVVKIEDRQVYQVVLKNITFTYICINGNMCIMHKVWENITQSVIYNLPLEWNGTEVWIGK